MPSRTNFYTLRGILVTHYAYKDGRDEKSTIKNYLAELARVISISFDAFEIFNDPDMEIIG